MASDGQLLATFSKHDIAGTVLVVIGAILLVAGWLRLMGKLAVSLVVPAAGVAIVVIGILFFVRTI